MLFRSRRPSLTLSGFRIPTETPSTPRRAGLSLVSTRVASNYASTTRLRRTPWVADQQCPGNEAYLTDTPIDEMMQIMTVPTPTTAEDFDLPATRGFVRMELAQLRTLMIAGFASLRNDLRTEFKSDQAGLRAELRAYHDSLRAELRADYDSLCAELKADMGALRAELRADHDSLRAELKADNRTLDQRITDVDRRLSAQLLDLTVAMERNHRSMLRWFVSTQIATITVVAILINSLRI